VSSTTQAATVTTLGANIILSGAMAQVWGMINALQLFTQLPLFKVNFPELSTLMVTSLITIATFDILPADDIYAATLETPDDDGQEDEQFDEIGFGSNYMILNLGTMFISLVIILATPVCIFMTKPCGKCSNTLKKSQESTMKSMKGNVFIRYLIEGFLDISICASLNYIYETESARGFRFDTTFHTVNNIAFFVLTIAIVVLPFWSIIFYCKHFEKWGDDEFLEKYGAIFEGLDLKKKTIFQRLGALAVAKKRRK